VLLIFDLVIGRTTALIMAGMTLLAVIILAMLPRFGGAGRSPHSPDGKNKIS
jgi:hypothetical protein